MKILVSFGDVVRRDKKILSFPVTFQDFLGSVGRKKKLFPEKNLHVILGKHKRKIYDVPMKFAHKLIHGGQCTLAGIPNYRDDR